MTKTVNITVPDIGDFHDVGVIEVFVKPGDTVAVDQPLITIETDKAAMDVPSTAAGVVKELKVKVGSKVNQGDVIVVVEASGAAPAEKNTPSPPRSGGEGQGEGAKVSTPIPPAPQLSPPKGGEGVKSTYTGPVDVECQLAVIGSGPGGYTAAFRGADLGLKTVLVERWPVLGGVCTTVGCIPSKALLHAARVIEEAEAMHVHGLDFGKPKIDLAKLRGFKEGVVKKSNDGLAGLARQRKVEVVNGTGKLLDAHHLAVEQDGKRTVVRFEHCILAAGSEPARFPGLPDDPRIIDSTGALELRALPERMLVIGGGIIGLEMACVYDALGVKVSVVELTDTLVPGADRDVMRPLETRIKKRYEAILLGTKVAKLEAEKAGIKVTFESADPVKSAPAPQHYGLVLVAVGRRPLGKQLDADKAGVAVDERGFVPSDRHMRTNVPHIYSIGDLRGNPMLAHKATHEGKLAAENAAGHKRAFDARVIPSVAYTDPEVAWVGLTETEAKAQGIKLGKGVFPWAASGRARSIAREDGLTKLLFDETTHRLVGAATTGVNAGELIGELALAIEMGANAEDIGLTIHPHPTLSETVAMAAEVFDGTITDLYAPKKR